MILQYTTILQKLDVVIIQFYCQLLLDPDPEQGEPYQFISGSSMLLPESTSGSRHLWILIRILESHIKPYPESTFGSRQQYMCHVFPVSGARTRCGSMTATCLTWRGARVTAGSPPAPLTTLSSSGTSAAAASPPASPSSAATAATSRGSPGTRWASTSPHRARISRSGRLCPQCFESVFI